MCRLVRIESTTNFECKLGFLDLGVGVSIETGVLVLYDQAAIYRNHRCFLNRCLIRCHKSLSLHLWNLGWEMQGWRAMHTVAAKDLSRTWQITLFVARCRYKFNPDQELYCNDDVASAACAPFGRVTVGSGGCKDVPLLRSSCKPQEERQTNL